MKIAILSTYDSIGGAARAAFRLQKGLIAKGVDSKMLVQRKDSDNSNVIGILSKKERLWSEIAIRLNDLPFKKYPNKEKYIFSPSTYGGFNEKRYNDQFDIFNIHWVGGGFQSIDSIAKITKPIVLTLHDSWAFTGGCHIPYPCEKFVTKCGSCIKLASTNENDLSTRIWSRKVEAWKNKNIVLVGDGNWVAGNAQKSAIFKNNKIEVIHPGLDTNVFKPLDKKACREILGLEENTNYILFGAIGATTDKNKGFQFLAEAIMKYSQNVDKKKNTKLLVFGASEENRDHYFGIETIFIGKVYDDITLSILYSAADVMIVPSIIESFGQTASESFACGTPVVAFDTSGLKDIVDHKVNGFLAKPYESNDLAEGINWVLEDSVRRVALGISGRKKAIEKFSIEKYVDSYINLYKSLI
jgi:glycosyltransferase involved in cell wall biosynthesis